MGNLRCINCENHALYEMECNVKNPNYQKRKLDLTTDLSGCFVKSKLHQSLDKAIELIKKSDNDYRVGFDQYKCR